MNIEIDIPEIDLDLNLGTVKFDNRYQKAKVIQSLPDGMIKYSNAKKLASKIDLDKNDRYNCIVAGNFIFGDFIEAFLVEHNLKCTSMTISTLSLDQNNIDSLRNLFDGDYTDKLDMIVSDYFYAHEKRALIPYMYEKLDFEDRFQLAVAGSHTKITLMELEDGRKIVMHGSANLRSSSNIEQFVIEINRELYDFWMEFHNNILEEYSTINKNIKKQKSIRGDKLWQVITQEKQQGISITQKEDGQTTQESRQQHQEETQKGKNNQLLDAKF